MLHRWLLLLVVAASALVAVQAALPPGFEDELYCPEGTCLHEKERPAGFTGPRVAFHQCVNVKTHEPSSSPRPWGHKFNSHYKEQLIRDGYHTNVCEQSMQVKAQTRDFPRSADGKGGKDAHFDEAMFMREMDRGGEHPEMRRMREERGAPKGDDHPMKHNPVWKAGEELRAKHMARDEERRKEFEERRAQHTKIHEERMAMLKEKHPEHYARMEERRAQLEKERETRMTEMDVRSSQGAPVPRSDTGLPERQTKPLAENAI